MAPKKARGTPTPEPPKEEEEEPLVTEEQLQGDFAWEDGSSYVGQYLKSSAGDMWYHGEGLLCSGSETFQGIFERGLYKAGRLQCRGGAVYEGPFRGGQFHGAGVYAWPGGQAYHGTFKDGNLHGRGRFVNFLPGEDYVGFCLGSEYSSDALEQKEARRKFLAEYNAACARSASAALTDMAERTAGGLPAEYCVPPEDAEAAQERGEVEAVVTGDFPEAADVPQDALKAFAALVDREGNASGTPQPDSPSALHVNVCESAEQSWRIEGSRLRTPQLRVAGQVVEFTSPPGEADNPIRAVVLANVSREFDWALAKWKLVHLEVATE